MLSRVTDKLYAFNNGQGIRFLLKHGDLGVYGSGKCWNLIMIENGNQTYVGCWCTRSDFHDCEKRYSIDKRIWTNMQEIIDSAEDIIMALN